jgi:hypothetical protein
VTDRRVRGPVSTRRSPRPTSAALARAGLVLAIACPFGQLACLLDPSPLGDLPDATASGGGGGGGGSGGLGDSTTGGLGGSTTGGLLPTTGLDTTTDADPILTTSSTTGDEPAPAPRCAGYDACDKLDVLFVIDNSSTMGEEQARLADSFPAFISLLRNLRDAEGRRVEADVQIMVTTTDVPHPLCTPFEKHDYDAADGEPVATPCTERLSRFTGLGANPPVMPEVCTAHCSPSAPAAPVDPFIRFSPTSHNVIDPDGQGDPAADALACIGPQGIDGCGMESPLEAMLRALSPKARWNSGARPFLRPGAPLAIILLTDETDCSALNFAYFDPKLKDDPEFNRYWPVDPDSGQRKEPTSATCWHAGMTCGDDDDDGVFEWCMSEDREVLYPVARYSEALHSLRTTQGKDIVMLVIGGVPPVTARRSDPPFDPLAGGVHDLVYRGWTADDISPGDPATPERKQYEFGIGPGCVGATGHAIPPGRIQELCQSLDLPAGDGALADEAALRCCIESVCDDDYTPALRCLTGMLRPTLRGAP